MLDQFLNPIFSKIVLMYKNIATFFLSIYLYMKNHFFFVCTTNYGPLYRYRYRYIYTYIRIHMCIRTCIRIRMIRWKFIG